MIGTTKIGEYVSPSEFEQLLLAYFKNQVYTPLATNRSHTSDPSPQLVTDPSNVHFRSLDNLEISFNWILDEEATPDRATHLFSINLFMPDKTYFLGCVDFTLIQGDGVYYQLSSLFEAATELPSVVEFKIVFKTVYDFITTTVKYFGDNLK